VTKNGLQADAYPAIVGSGPNGNQWHYMDNGRRTEAGDLVVMDYAGALDYLTVDITRTWPVSGRFTDEQRRAYECVLDAQLAMIAAMRPGAARDVIREAGERVFRERGFDPRYAYSGHYVGLSVHDVGDWALPLQAGMVLAIEPILDLPERRMHVRVEDTVLITSNGAEVLTQAVPKRVPELLRLASSGR
jgi:Xaa-Pro aminopeptidase